MMALDTAHTDRMETCAYTLCRPAVEHGSAIHALVEACKPLDLNSRYAYLLLCEHFADSCVLAHTAGRVVGFTSAYKPPARDNTIFVWQVAVAGDMRGKGIAAVMLRELLTRRAVSDCIYLETTISPSNAPSRRLFHALARERCAPIDETLLFAEQHFGGEAHECEMLIRIGPLRGKRQQGDC